MLDSHMGTSNTKETLLCKYIGVKRGSSTEGRRKEQVSTSDISFKKSEAWVILCYCWAGYQHHVMHGRSWQYEALRALQAQLA